MKDALKRIWWVASYPKSGSTWVRMFVNAYLTGFPLELNSPWQYVAGDLQPHTYQLTAAASIDKLGDVACVYYRPAVLMNHILCSRAKDLALKTHHANAELDGMPLIPPRLTKKALYIVRDPRDVAVSLADHLGRTVDETINLMAANDYKIFKEETQLYHLLLSWSSHVDSWTLPGVSFPVSVVKYEKMVERPGEAFVDVLRALGLPEDREDRFSFALEQTDFRKLQEAEDSQGFQEKGKGERFFRKGAVGGWKDVLTAEQAQRIETNHRATMSRFGYVTSKKPNTMPSLKSVAAGSVG